MPLSELWRLSAEKLESGQQRPCPNDISLPAENDLVELVWENGQIAMQNQSRRCSGSLALNGLPPTTSRIRDSMPSNTARVGKFGGVESILDDMSSVVPSGELDLGQDDEMVPWLNYPIGDALPHDYMSDLLPEISGVTANALSTQNSFAAMDKRSGNCDGSTSKSSSSKVRLINSWPTQHRQTTDPLVSGFSNTTSIGNTNSHLGTTFRNAAKGKDALKEAGSMDTVRSNVGIPSSNSNVMNFPYFSRPATLVKASIPNSEGIPNLISSEAGRTEVKLLDRSNSMQKNVDFRVAASSKIAVNLGKEPPSKNDKPVISANVVNPMKGVVDSDRNVEPMVVSSSVGSGNSADEQTHNSSKRKFHEVEESECRSDDIDTVSIGATKLASARGGNGSKRSRAAEVHNLSERRRRDRINEKMRALQELIPNCNKVDKASMLDEAIEYLKTLQLQVQIMSMGAGLYMPPPMMFPTMRPPHVPHFPPMGVGVGVGVGVGMGMGMGMGLGFGISMPDANGASPSCPIFSVPPMHFASPGPGNFPRIPASSAPVYGHPSHSSVLHAPLAPVTGQPPVTTSAMGITAGSSGKQKNKSNELEAKNEILDQSATGQEDKSATNDPAPSPLTSATETGTNRETG